MEKGWNRFFWRFSYRNHTKNHLS